MADLTQHANYTGAYSGLLNNLWLTLSIGGVCLLGYEIEVRIPRRRGWAGGKKWAVVRIWSATGRVLTRIRRRKATAAAVTHGEAKSGTEKQMRDGKGKGKADMVHHERQRVGDREQWEFGYIYQPKTWGMNASRPVPAWPLMWAWDILKIKESDMPPVWGLDITLHLRFLRACLFYTLLHLIIVAPILIPLHILYSPKDVDPTSMIRASVSSLVASSGSKWLWVHATLIWWITSCWLGTVIWIIWGGIGYRRREVLRLRRKVEGEQEQRRMLARGEDGLEAAATESSGSTEETRHESNDIGVPGPEFMLGDEPVGVKRFRTLMVQNIPPDMRDEETLEDYFDHYLSQHHLRVLARARPNLPAALMPSRSATPVPTTGLGIAGLKGLFKKAPRPSMDATAVKEEKRRPSLADDSGSDTAAPGRTEADSDGSDEVMESEVEEVILVRKLGSLISLRDRRLKVLRELEMAHVKLARRVLSAVAAHKQHLGQANSSKSQDETAAAMATLRDEAKEGLGYGKLTKKERLDKLTAVLGRYVGDEPEQMGHGTMTVWEALHSLPRPLLDPYQDLTHLRLTSRFRKTNAPLIDYLTTKLAYLTILLDDARSKPMASYPASSAAFVTFRDARSARLALKVAENHPKRRLACKAQPAPNWVELLWPRLGLSVYRSEFVRGWVAFLGVWLFTLAWIFPVSLFCALTSLTNIAGFLPPLKDWLDANPETASAITSLAPVILVALLTIAICPILLVIANKAETIVTRLGVHNSVLERFWKFLMVNGVVFFAIGQSAIEAYLTAFQTNSFDPLPVVASAFPTAAPYFASYILLQVAIQPCFEIFRFGLPAIVYWFGTRWSKIPRQRHSRTEYPTFSHFSQLPYQLLAGAIMHLFMLLNPLVIPFTLIYYATCYIVWKRQFTYVYGRLYENNGRRSCVRILRYSLDALALGQFVLFAFFILNRASGEAISTGILFFITLGLKLVITRAVKQRFDNLEIEEADVLCPPVPRNGDSGDTDRQTMIDEFSDQDDTCHTPHPHTTLRLQSKFGLFRERLHEYVHRYAYDSAILPPGYRKPIPFDWVLFAWLDRYFTYKLDSQPVLGHHDGSDGVKQMTATAMDKEDRKAIQLVAPHHKLVSWEDIPPYWRSRGYDDQPAYTEGYDDFLWLPRDPLSTLDLDDTVEMRASLTTSAGGDGRFGGFEEDEEEQEAVEEIGEGWNEIVARSSVSGAEADLFVPEDHEQDAGLSPIASSGRHLLTAMDQMLPSADSTTELRLPEHIGSEIQPTSLSTVRKGTIKFADNVQSIFRRPRSDTVHTSHSEALTMRTVSNASGSTPSVVIPVTDSPELILDARGQQELNPGLLTPHRPTMRPLSPRLPSMSEDDADGDSSPSRRVPSSPTEMSAPRSAPALGSRITFSSQNQTDLGRSPSGRRPVMPHRGSQSSGGASGNLSRLISPAVGVAPSLTSPSIRSASAFSQQRRDRSSSTISAQQQALLREVMEEERIASASARHAERAGLEAEKEEVRKERERAGGPLPPPTPTTAGSDARRRLSISSSAAGADLRRNASTATGRMPGLGGASMVAIAANRFAAGRRRGHTFSIPMSVVGSDSEERGRSGSGSAMLPAPSPGLAGRASVTEMGQLRAAPSASGSGEKTIIQAQLEQPRSAGHVSGDTSGSSRTGPAGGVGGLAGVGI